MIIKCTYSNELFYKDLEELIKDYKFITQLEGYNNKYSDTKRKGIVKCKSPFSAKLDPFVGIWVDNKPIKGFYSEVKECNIENIKKYLNNVSNKFNSENTINAQE